MKFSAQFSIICSDNDRADSKKLPLREVTIDRERKVAKEETSGKVVK